MEQKKDLTKKLIAESFQSLLEKHPFDKITIRMITDQAGLIRPTFYNHFQDKYDLVEWIFSEDIVSEVDRLLQHGMQQEAIKFLFTGIHKNRKFYAKMLQVSGQNSLEEVLVRRLEELFRREITEKGIKDIPQNRVLNVIYVSRYYALGLATSIEAWLAGGDNEVSVDELTEAYEFLITHSIYDIINEDV